MRDAATDGDCRVDLALQGPASLDVLAKLADDEAHASQLSSLKSFALAEVSLGGINCIVSTTGYTGAKTAFELFVHPEHAATLWSSILAAGQSSGVLPCGLGARDSLRIEAGLPLYGHELNGHFGITPFQAGYGWAVKLAKPFFIGKAPMVQAAESFDMKVVRVELPATKGIRPVRPDDPILDKQGVCVGWILSSAKVEEKQYALVYAARDAVEEGAACGAYYLARSESQLQQGRKERVEKGQTVEADLAGVVAGRFAKF